MKTLLICTSIEELPKFAIVDGDYSHLHGVCVNYEQNEEDKKKTDDLMTILYDVENGWVEKVHFSKDISLLIRKEWDTAITFFIWC